MISAALRRRALLAAFMLGDILIAWIALNVAVHRAPFEGVDFWTWNLLWTPAGTPPALTFVVLLAWHLLLMVRGLYASHRLEGIFAEALQLLGCACLLAGIAAVAAVFLAPEFATPSFVGSLLVLLALMVMVTRGLLRRFLRRLHLLGRNLRAALVVGTGERARRLAQALRERNDLGYWLVGCVDDVAPGDPALLPWLGRLDDLHTVLANNVVDEVFIALPMRSSYERIQQAVQNCEEQGALVTMPVDFFAARLARTRLGRVGLQPVLYLSAVPENDWRIVVKKSIDFFGATALIVLLAPVLLGVAVAVRWTSPGPAIFRQTRIGLNKRPFEMYKFRTMVQDAELRQAALEAQNEASGPVFKIRKDPRITSIGSFLRRSSLDELPQLFNVLRGEMSLVGPRPLPLRDVSGFQEDWQRRRFSVLPGIACLWQISGRSDISFEEWMALDLKYIDEWSLRLDFTIMLKTVGVVLRGRGAY